MKDMIPKGTGNSRKLKSSLSTGTTWEQALEMLRAGTFPIDLNGLNADGIQQEGTALNKANLLSDDTASALGLSGDPTVDDALKASAGKVGDIKITTRTDLGNDWLLCNGAGVSSDDYPELTPMLPKELNNVNVETQTTGIPSSASTNTFTIENNKLFIITHEDSNWYIYSCDIGKNNWVKSNTSIFSGNTTPGAFSFVSYANGYYYASIDSRSQPTSTSASITFPYIYRSSDLVNWSACTVTLVFSEQLTTWNSGVFLYVGTIKYNSTTQKYCVPISFYDWSATSTSCRFIMPVGTINGSNITVTTDRIRANSTSYFTNSTYLNKTYFFRGLTTIGNYFVLPEYDTSQTCNELFMSDSSATISVEKSVLLGQAGVSTNWYNYAALACEIDGNIAVITNRGVFKVTGEYGSMTSSVNTNLAIESTHSVTGIYHDAANKTIYVILRNENTIKKYVYNNIFTDTGFVSTESKPINEETSVEPDFRGVTPSGWCYVMSYAPKDVKIMSPAESYMLPTIDVDKAYAYIKGR